MVTKRIILASLFFLGCAAETAPPVENAPPESAQEATPPVTAAPSLVAQEKPLLAWSFEPASADCNGWPVAGGKAIRAAPARSGTYSCKVCATGDTPEIALGRELGDVPAGSYRFTAWIRKRAATAAPGEALARIVAETSEGTVQAEAPAVSVREEWDRLEAHVVLGAGATRVHVTVGSPATEADRCLLIDDVSLERE